MKTVKTTSAAPYHKVPTTITIPDHVADKMLANGWAVEVDENVEEVKDQVVAPVPAAKQTIKKQTIKKQTK